VSEYIYFPWVKSIHVDVECVGDNGRKTGDEAILYRLGFPVYRCGGREYINRLSIGRREEERKCDDSTGFPISLKTGCGLA
jgi:hypothetical protein